jgi:Tol biopolymer transport system component
MGMLVALSLLLLAAGQSASAETYEQAVEGTASLAHFWPMGEASGSSFADAVGGADAEVAGGVTLGEPGGLVGDSATAALFGGSGSAQAGVDLSGSGKLTVEFWMKWKAFANDDALAMEFTPNFNEHAGGFLVDPNASVGTFGVGVGEYGARNNVFFARPSAEAWHYYAFVIDTEGSGATEIKPYVDGHEVSYTKSESGTGGGFANSTLYWMSRDASSLFGSGSMQDLALYEGTLSATAILEHYEVGEGGPKASFTSAPVVASAGVPVRLDASGSSSPSGSITDHAWDFNGSKTYSTDAGSSATTSHTFASPGTYTVDLRVEDALGETATVSKTITVGAAPGRYRQAVEALSSVAHLWPMSEASGASFADVFAGADASVAGGVTLGEPGALVGDTSTAALFDGSSGAAHAGVDLSGSGKLTVEFWMKWKAFANDDALAMEFTPNFNEHTGGFLVDPNASTGEFGVGVGESASRNNVFFARPSAEAWHYYAFVIDTEGSGATEIKPYVDGHEVSYTKSESGTGGGFADSTLYWMSRDASSLFGSGAMQNLALYDGTLSSTTVLEHYEIGEGGPKASFTSAPVEATVRVPVRLDASGSSSPAGSIGDYAWDFNGAKGYGTDAGSSATTSHTFAAPGTYTVDLRVKDGLGETATVSHTITVGAALGAYAQAVEDTPAVSHFWPMGESSGSSFADVFSGSDASLAGGVTLGEPGGLVEDSSTAALFNGSSGAASAPVDLSGSGKLTVEFWMKWKAFANDDALAMEFTPNFNEHAGGFLVDPNASGGGTFGVGVGEGSSRNNVYFARPSAEAWHHYAFVIDTTGSGASEIKPYVDGHEVSYTKTESGTGGGFANSTLYWMSRDASSLFGSGAMQNLALYDDALDGTTIAEHYAWGENTYRPVNTTAPSIEGTAQDGQALTANPGAWSGFEPIHYAYQWQSCNLGGEECQDIEGATDQTYTPTSGDLETTLRVVVTASNTGSSAHASSPASAELESGAPSELEAPSISGDPRAGETLFADAGVWGGTETEVGYQWERCNATGGECASIVGATEPEYALGEGDIGTTLRVRVGVSNALGSLTAVSSATEAISDVSSLRNTWAPSVSGTPQSGQTLTANAGSWLGLATIGYAYQWQSCDGHGSGCEDIEGATASTYVLETGDVSNTLRVRVSATEVGGTVAQTTAATQPIAAASSPVSEEPPTVQGTSLQGYALTATTGAWSGGEGPLTYGYQWQRCDEHGASCSSIGGATAGTHTLTEGDVGSTLRVLVTATDGASHATTAASDPTALISPTTLVNITTPSISGTHQLGRALSADPGIWTAAGAIAYAYQWERCDEHGESCSAITGATESSYTTGEADVGDTVKVTVTATGTGGTDSATSAATPAILSEPIAPENQSPPSIEGNLTAGDTLTAQPGSWLSSESISYGYQWQRCDGEGEECADIEGATSSTYTLGEGDIDSTLQVVVTASNSLGSASATSPQSIVVGAAGPPTNTDRPVIHGTAKEGERLVAGNGSWSGSRPLSYYYRWERCNSEGESCTSIEEATEPSYTVVSGDVGSTLRVKVTATNSLGSAGAVSTQAIVTAGGEASTTSAIEIAEETDPSVLAPATTATLEEQEVKPAISDTDEELSAATALTSSSISKETPGEFAVNTPDGELSFEPVETSPNATKTPTIVNGAAAVFAETSRATDTIVRPDALGATTLLQLRSSEAPTSFSWEVGLGPEQKLEQLSDGSVAVVEIPPGSLLEGSLEESLESPEPSEATPEPGEEPGVGEAAEEELEEGLPEESSLERLPAAPQASTPEITPKAGELHPQETKAQYEGATSSMASSEEETGGTTLLVIKAPTVLDVEGNSVSASLSIHGDTITMAFSLGESTKFPLTSVFDVGALSDKASAVKAKGVLYGLWEPHASQFEHSEEQGEEVDKFDARLKTTGPLHMATARLALNYNTPPSNTPLKEWVSAVDSESVGLEPFITLQECESSTICTGEAPSPVGYRKDVERLMRAFPQVKIWGAWNEPDNGKNPLHPLAKAEKAAFLWQEAQRAASNVGCKCTVVAGEFQEYDRTPFENHEAYIARYVNTIIKKHRYWRSNPAVWGLHDYKDLAQISAEHPHVTTEAQRFMRIVPHVGKRQMWVTEAGVELQDGNKSTRLAGSHCKYPLKGKCKLQELAAKDFLQLKNVSTKDGRAHIGRVYYSLYRGVTKKEIEENKHNKHLFDSAVLEGEGSEPGDWRPAYCVLAFANHRCSAGSKTESVISSTRTPSASTVLATIDPRGSATNYWLEWGTSTEYGHVTTATAVANENGEQSETVSLSGLEPCTTYHYQALAENEANEGTPSLGGDRTFKTRCEVGIFLARDGAGTPTELWEVKADGSGAHSLGAPPEGGEPSLSPDGSLIAYASNKYPYPPEIRIRGVGGGSSTTIYTYSSGGASILWPRWSPDGSKLIFPVSVSGGESRTMIDSINVDGTGLKTLVTIPNAGGIHAFPSYSPDGSKIVFLTPAGGGGFQIDEANSDGSNVHAVTDPTEIEPEEQPRFSPDGTKIAFSGALLSLEYNQRIYTINTDGSDLTEVTHGFTEASEEWAFEPEWTPDGAKIVYAYELGTTNKLQKYELYVVNADGSGEATPFLPSLSGVTESWGMSFAP